MNKCEQLDFREYLRQCTDRQVQGVYDKETAAGRKEEAAMALEEAEERGIVMCC